MDQVLRVYGTVLSDEISLLFCAVILGWLAISTAMLLVPHVARRAVPAGIISLTSSGLATLGLLGTFTGILIGLLDFDITRVDESVPHLLAGLKIAFTTSIVGMTAALVFRILLAIAPRPVTGSSVTPAHIHEALVQISEGQEKSSAALAQEVTALRQIVQTGQDRSIEEFRSFSDTMTDNNQRAIVTALEKIVHDFNSNLTTQFGQNFAKLNEAVFALVEWQDKYRTHVDMMEQRHSESAAALAKIELSLGMIRSHSERIPQAIAPLGPVLKHMSAHGAQLQEQLTAYADIRDKAIEAFPIIEDNLDKLTQHLERAIQSAVMRSQDALETSATSQGQVLTSMENYLSTTEDAHKKFTGELDKALGQISTRAEEEFTRHRALMETSAKEAQKAIAESWAQSHRAMTEVSSRLDSSAQKDFQKTLQLVEKSLVEICKKLGVEGDL